MKQTSTAKYQHIRANLEAAIHSGEFAVGEQLPTEQTLADRFGVSYLTARRAVCELVEADLLERRARKGTFVRARSHEAVVTTLSLITSSYDHSLMREFINRGVRLAESKGWQPNIIRLSAGQQDAAVRAIRNGDLALVLLDEIKPNSALGHAMRAAKGKAICLGSPTLGLGAPCILNDPDEFFQTAVDYLVAKGHRDIVFVSQSSEVPAQEIQNEAWHKATSVFLSKAEADVRSIHIPTAIFHCPTPDAYNAVRDFLAKGEQTVTAFLSFGDEITQGVLAAIRESGMSVPDEISVLNILDSPTMRFYHPPVSSLDVNFKRQFEIALEILENAQNGEFDKEKSYFVEPRIIERKSVCPIPLSISAQIADFQTVA